MSHSLILWNEGSDVLLYDQKFHPRGRGLNYLYGSYSKKRLGVMYLFSFTHLRVKIWIFHPTQPYFSLFTPHTISNFYFKAVDLRRYGSSTYLKRRRM